MHAVVFLALSIPRAIILLKQAVVVEKSKGSRLLCLAKTVSGCTAIIGHLVALSAWTTAAPTELQSGLTYAMITFDLAASITLTLVSNCEHYRCFRSSLLLQW